MSTFQNTLFIDIKTHLKLENTILKTKVSGNAHY
jgi:hypothetical protein